MISTERTVTQSFIGRRHPLAKIIVAAGFTFYSLFLERAAALGLILVFLLSILLLSRLKPNWKFVIGTIWLITLFGIINYFVDRDPNRTAMYSLRLLIFIIAIPLSALTTAPQDIARSLSKLNLPDGIIISVLMIWRFFPLLVRETTQIKQADMLRGATGGVFLHRWYRTAIVPFTFMLFEHSDRISLALELRGFNPSTPRTWYNLPAVKVPDFIFLVTASMVAAIVAWIEWPNFLP